jgi:hypothetical protein
MNSWRALFFFEPCIASCYFVASNSVVKPPVHAAQ